MSMPCDSLDWCPKKVTPSRRISVRGQKKWGVRDKHRLSDHSLQSVRLSQEFSIIKRLEIILHIFRNQLHLSRAKIFGLAFMQSFG